MLNQDYLLILNLNLNKIIDISNEVNRLNDLKELDALIMELFNINKDILKKNLWNNLCVKSDFY